ncbi:MAG: hypothetical protein Q9167_006036 [Letrouitia subvulpina]
MSDDDDDFMQESDNEQYDFEYEDDDDEEGGDVGIENKYYNAKQLKVENPDEALDEFLGMPAMEDEKGDWGFKGLKQAIKLEFKLSNTNNERLWLKTNIKLARLWLERKEYTELVKKVRDLHKACQREDGTDDPNKGTYALEVYALEIQMYAETKNNKRLKVLYQRALKVRSAVPHPKIMGIIRECGGKMHLSEENWQAAQTDFHESFHNYDEAGSLQRMQVLKYLVLTTMLMKSEINPFDSQETKPYKNDPSISAMTDLVDAYQRDDIHRYESILQNNKDVLADPFIAENIDEVTRNMRTKGVLKLIAPYTRFHLAFVAKQLKISTAEVEDIVGFLIVDNKLKGKINQERGTVEILASDDVGRIRAMQEWTSAVKSLCTTILDEGDGFKADDSSQAFGGTSFSGFSSHVDGGTRTFTTGVNGGGKSKGRGRKGGFGIGGLK